VLVSAKPLIVMQTIAPVVVRDTAICGKLEGLDRATFTVDGRPADAATTDKLLYAIVPGFAPLAGREVCTTYVPDGADLKAEVRLDGARRPDMDARVRWVGSADGYAVRP